MSSGIFEQYFGRGLDANLPDATSLGIPDGTLGLYYATDTLKLYALDGAGTGWDWINQGDNPPPTPPDQLWLLIGKDGPVTGSEKGMASTMNLNAPPPDVTATLAASGSTLRQAARDPNTGRIVCTSSNGKAIWTDDNGDTFSAEVPVPSGTDLIWVCWDDTNSNFVTVGTSGYIATSPNGETGTWTQKTSGTSMNFYTVEEYGGVLIACGNGTASFRSTDGGTTWSAGGVLPGTGRWHGMAVNLATGQYVVSGEFGNVAYTINAGVTWTACSGGVFGSDYWTDGSHSPEQGLWAFMSDNGKVIVSTDGITFAAAPDLSVMAGGTRLDYFDTIWLAAGGTQDTGKICYTTDPRNVDWTLIDNLNDMPIQAMLPLEEIPPTDLGKWLLSGKTTGGGDAMAARLDLDSPPPTTTFGPGASGSTLRRSCRITTGANTGRIVAVGTDGILEYTDNEGVSWSACTGSAGQDFVGVCWTGTNVVAVGISGANGYSANGAAWTMNSAIAAGSHRFQVAYFGGLLITVGQGTSVQRSTNHGVSWSAGTALPASDYHALAVNSSGLFVAGGPSGHLTRTSDGVTWTDTTSGAAAFAAVYHNGTTWAAIVTSTGATVHSTDGASWTAGSTVPMAAGSDISFGNNLWVASGGAVNVAYTDDIVAGTWTAVSTGSRQVEALIPLDS